MDVCKLDRTHEGTFLNQEGTRYGLPCIASYRGACNMILMKSRTNLLSLYQELVEPEV